MNSGTARSVRRPSPPSPLSPWASSRLWEPAQERAAPNDIIRTGGVARKRRTPRAQAHRGGTTAGDGSHGARYSSVHLRGPPGYPGPSAAARERTAAADGLWRDQGYAPAPSRPNRAASTPPGRASAVLAGRRFLELGR